MHFSHRLTTQLAAGLLTAVTLITPSLAATHVGTVVSPAGLNVRAESNTTSQVLATLANGTSVDVLKTSPDGRWHQVSYQGTQGYVSGDYLSVTEQVQYGQVVVGPLNVRSGPGTQYAKTGSLPTAAVVEIQDTIGGMGGWYQIDGGYVSSDYVAIVDPSAVNSSSNGNAIVQNAMQYLGSPYVYGGSSPRGFDCSGFTRYVCSQSGYSLNRTSSAQMDNGTPVARSQVQPGDLMFFNKNNPSKRATHVGIYIGNNQIVHASSPGVGVIITDLSSSSYESDFVGARRLG